MGFHHVALATNNTEATHRFYTEVMGFELVKVVASETPNASQDPNAAGFSKHFFYSTAGTDPSQPESGDPGMIAFWEIHDPAIGDDFSVDINKAAGLPWWVNHIAFDAPTRESLDGHRRRWQEHGHTVLEVDHEFCVSIYIRDPSGNMVEFCHTTRPFTDEELSTAEQTVRDPNPAMNGHAKAIVHDPILAEASAS
jgi:catechol 2,3-dioxygenase-like lactoylglutathione lyase family enzyme